MKPVWMYFLSLMIAALAGVLVVIAAFALAVPDRIILIWTIVSSADLLVLFLRMLLDRRCLEGVQATSLEIQRDSSLKPPPLSMLHPKWGLFGSRMGSTPLPIVRLTLFAEFIAAVFVGPARHANLILLSGVAFSITIMITIINLGLQKSSDDPAAP